MISAKRTRRGGAGRSSLFGGYDFWVGDNWGVGVNARYMYAHGERRFDADGAFSEPRTINGTAHTFGVMFSVLYD